MNNSNDVANIINEKLICKDFLQKKILCLRAEEQEISRIIFQHPHWKEEAITPYQSRIEVLQTKINDTMARLINLENEIKEIKYNSNSNLHPIFADIFKNFGFGGAK